MRLHLIKRCITALLPIMAVCVPMVSQVTAANSATEISKLDVPDINEIAVGDLNGDGKADVAAAQSTYPRNGDPVYRLHLFFQKDGAIPSKPDLTLDLPTRASGLLIGDYNKDGKNELIVGLRGKRSIAVYTQTAGFDKPIISAYNNDSGAASLNAGRINDRGYADFLTGASWRKWMDGANQFENAYFGGPERNDHYYSTLADLDNGGGDDVIFTTFIAENPPEQNNCIRILYGPFLGQRDRVVPAKEASEIVTLNTPLTGDKRKKALLGRPFVGDLNGDGRPDIIVSGGIGTYIYFQNSPMGFSQNANPSLILEGCYPLLVNDINADGMCDLLLQRTDGKLVVWRQQKNQPLSKDWQTQAQIISLPRAVGAVAVGDINGDGKNELLAAAGNSGVIVFSIDASKEK